MGVAGMHVSKPTAGVHAAHPTATPKHVHAHAMPALVRNSKNVKVLETINVLDVMTIGYASGHVLNGAVMDGIPLN